MRDSWAASGAVSDGRSRVRPAARRGGGRPLVLNADVVRSISGRAVEVERFRWGLVVLVPLVLFLPVYLLAWALEWNSQDRAVGVQIGFGITLAIVGLALLARTTRTGTDVTWTGIRRHLVCSVVTYPWTDIRGFTTDWRGRSGVWVVVPPESGGADIAVPVPSGLHRWKPEEATAVVDQLNTALGTRPPESEVHGPTDFERLCAWTWLLPLVTFGIAGVCMLIAAASSGRKLWLWIVTAVAFDANVVFWATLNDTGTAQVVPEVTLVVISLGPSLALLVGWLGARRDRLLHLPG